MEENKICCSHCGVLIENEDFDTVNGEPICQDCAERYTVVCDRCGATIWESDAYGDEYTNLCRHCYENHYTRCSCCDTLLHEDDAYHLNGYDYCHDCYDEERDKCRNIHDYGYKPEPIFYGDSDRYFGVELEIDGAGKDDDYAEELLEIGNKSDEHIYIKSDGSLDDGMEIVSHPMTLNFHKDFCWEDIMRKAISLGYRSHQTLTCGLHIHVNRDCLGEDRDDQEMVIGKILYFVEHHWNEMLKFSRRSEYSINRWAARYGYENSPKAILEKAKKGNCGRYAAVNLMNYSTIEFRLFRGTLKHSTFIATLELVNAIIETALYYSEDELHKLSWSEFVRRIDEPELIQYLKERQLYINETIESEEEM
ncbi:MAG: zinc-binding protein [Ruminococcus sp.]|nr:zinc-binding protein [Ruminococcus sp.]